MIVFSLTDFTVTINNILTRDLANSDDYIDIFTLTRDLSSMHVSAYYTLYIMHCIFHVLLDVCESHIKIAYQE